MHRNVILSVTTFIWMLSPFAKLTVIWTHLNVTKAKCVSKNQHKTKINWSLSFEPQHKDKQSHSMRVTIFLPLQLFSPLFILIIVYNSSAIKRNFTGFIYISLNICCCRLWNRPNAGFLFVNRCDYVYLYLSFGFSFNFFFSLFIKYSSHNVTHVFNEYIWANVTRYLSVKLYKKQNKTTISHAHTKTIHRHKMSWAIR